MSKEIFRRVLKIREFMLLVIILIISIFFSLTSPYFATFSNWEAIAYGMMSDCIIAVGMTIVIVGGGFDLSVGAVLALCGILVAKMLNANFSMITSILVGGILLGGGIGLFNGVMVARLKINPFVVTLGMMSVARGIGFAITQGRPVVGLPPEFGFLGQGKVLGFPFAILLMILVVVIGDLLMRKSLLLRRVYYVGGNEEAARFSGLNVERIRIMTYVITGVLAGLSGVLITSRMFSATATAGMSTELRAIAAVVIGGGVLAGGKGTIFGAFLGTLLLGIITDALVLYNVSVYWQQVASGIILISVVTIDVLSRRGQE